MVLVDSVGLGDCGLGLQDADSDLDVAGLDKSLQHHCAVS